MADGETVQDTCLETVIILAFLSGDASDKEIAHFPCEIKYKLCFFVVVVFCRYRGKSYYEGETEKRQP